MPFERPSGSFSNPAAGAETGLGGLTPDVQTPVADGGLINSVMTPMNGADAKVAAEAGALAGKAVGAIGNAAIAAIPAGGEQISPLIQLIMKLPGGMGVASSFFEWLTNFFTGGDLIKLFDPMMLQASLGSQLSMLNQLATGAHSFTVSLAQMPGDSMFNTLGQAGRSMGTMDFSKLSPSAAEHFTQNPANIGAQADLRNAQFETGATSAADSAVAGPAVTQASQSNFVAGNQRLFSDRIGSGASFNSVTSATNVPSTTGIPNNSGATFGQEGPAMPKVPDGTVSGPAVGDTGMQMATQAQPALDSASSSIADKLGTNAIASDVSSYRPTMGGYWSPQASSPSTAGSGDFIQPLKAKQLTYQDLHKGADSVSKQVMDQMQQEKLGPGAAFGSPRIDPISQQVSMPKAHAPSTASAQHAPQPRHSQSYQMSNAKSSAQHQPSRAPETHVPQSSDQVAQATDQVAAPGDTPGSYMVQRGDNLWNIAQKHLGDGSKWTEIYKMNSDAIGSNPDLIFSGTELKLPGVGDQIADAGKYVVKPGDNLWDIAQKQFGDGSKWGDLYKANADVIGANPSLIQPGQQLSMPGAGEAIAQATPVSNMTQAALPQGMPTDPSMAAQPMSMQAATQPMSMQSASQPVVGMEMPQTQVQPVVQYQQYPVESIPTNSAGVIQVQPAQELPAGPGAAGAATLKSASNSVVSSSLAPDLSFLNGQPDP